MKSAVKSIRNMGISFVLKNNWMAQWKKRSHTKIGKKKQTKEKQNKTKKKLN